MKLIPDNYQGEPQGQTAEVPTWGPSVTSYFTQNEAELLYVEQYVPRAGDNIHIYWSGCNFFFGARGGYAGIQHQNNNLIGDQVFTYNNICSIWDLADSPNDSEVRLDYGIEGLHSSHFGGEGTGLHTSHPMPWNLDQWYALVIRRWFVPNETVTRMAMFMYSYTDDKWTHYMSASVPDGDVSLTGTTCSGFLERFNGEALGYHGFYGQHFRMNKDGSWQKPTHYEAGAGGDPHAWNAEVVDGANIKLIAGGWHPNDQSSIRLDPNQFDAKPKVVQPPKVQLGWLSYDSINGNLYAEWSLPANTPPQLGYRIEVRPVASGGTIASNSNLKPQQRNTRFDTGILASGNYIVSIVITDIFNQHSVSSSKTFKV